MRKPVFAICEQQRRRSACASAQSDQRLCFSLPSWYKSSSFYIQNFKPLPSFCGCESQFESTLVGNLEDRFSCDEALMFYIKYCLNEQEIKLNEPIFLKYSHSKNHPLKLSSQAWPDVVIGC